MMGMYDEKPTMNGPKSTITEKFLVLLHDFVDFTFLSLLWHPWLLAL